MNFKKTILFLLSLIIVSFFIFKIYQKYLQSPPPILFKTEKIQKRDIHQNIYATGTLEIKDNMKIGSLVAGTILKIYVKENEFVKKGQLLVLIDNGKGDTDVKKTEGEVLRTKANLEYQEKYYKRQEALYKTDQISKNYFDVVTKDLLQAKANVKIAEALYEKESIDYANTKVYAPDEGTIFNIGITVGLKITTDLDATVLCEIAKDIKRMEADLDIDESDISQVKEGQKVNFNISAYPEHIFKGKIVQVSYVPKKTHAVLSYKARVEVNYGTKNRIYLLRPGMTINAKIIVDKRKNCNSIPSQAFQINPDLLKQIAKKINYSIKSLNKSKKKKIKQDESEKEMTRYVWIVQNQNFIETAIKTNITDDNYFEITNNEIKDGEEVIVDIEEPDEIEGLYKKMFKSTF